MSTAQHKLQDVQKDPDDTKAESQLKPYQHYNKFIRREGEKVLSEEEFNIREKQILDYKKANP